jgi:sigma-B regulation protein RsbU (phosphoserine phosphatase)
MNMQNSMTPIPPRNHKRHGLAFRLTLFILTGTILIFLAAFGYNYYCSRQLVLKNVREVAMNLTQATALKIESTLRSVEKLPRLAALHLENENVTDDMLLPLLEDMVAGTPEIYGSAAAFEPHALDPRAMYYAPYFHHDDSGQVAFTQLGSSAYNYFLLDWYLIPKQLDRPVWSEPYFDEGGGDILMATYSHPFYDRSPDRRVFRGVVTADISLESLVTAINSIALYESGYAFLISRKGIFLAHPDRARIMRDSVFSVAEAHQLPELRHIGQDMIRGRQGFAFFTSVHTGKRSLLSYAPVPASGWSVGVMIPETELFADIRTLNHTVGVIGAVGCSLLFLVVVTISRTITRPLHHLVRTTAEIARGNLDVALPDVRTRGEVEVLTRSVDEMRLALKEYIHNLTETTRANERIESELKIARTIQMSFLPKRFPPFPDQSAFDLFAALEPAKQVGGDLYDFFLLDERHLFISVGDVSDKGVPAALFMAVTKTLIKGIAEQGLTPADVLTRVNRELCQGNDSAMFVTVVCGILDIATGELTYSNAGHNPPVMLRSGRAPEWLPLPPGGVLGVMEEAVFATRSVRLRSGDRLLLYTDGVTEAMDAGRNLFSDERLLREVQSRAAAGTRQLVERVMAAVQEHAAGAVQSDDITMLALLFKGEDA